MNTFYLGVPTEKRRCNESQKFSASERRHEINFLMCFRVLSQKTSEPSMRAPCNIDEKSHSRLTE